MRFIKDAVLGAGLMQDGYKLYHGGITKMLSTVVPTL
jgi:hypothetical protein